MTTYVIETNRVLSEPYKGHPKQLEVVDAIVFADGVSTNKRFNPEEWRKLLGAQGVKYRHRDDKVPSDWPSPFGWPGCTAGQN